MPGRLRRGDIARLAYETVREMAAATDETDARAGMVAVIQTFGSSLKWQPVWNPDGEWIPIPYVDAHRAELLLRDKLLGLLRDRGLMAEERIDLLLSWRHSSFTASAFTITPSSIPVTPRESTSLRVTSCGAPVNLSRQRFDHSSGLLVYEPRHGHGVDDDGFLDPLEFVARVLIRMWTR